MARIDNLSNFIQDVGQAIKEKKGIPQEQKIQVRNFDTEIASIETGGGGGSGSLEYLMRDSQPTGSKAILTQDGDGTLKAVIPDNITSIGDNAFAYNQLTSVVIPDGVTSIGGGAFSNNQLTSVVIPSSVTSIDWNAFQNNQLTSVVIPDSVTSIGASAFQYNQLTSVVIPHSVTYIDYAVFSDNQLTSVVIPDSVTSIGGGAFSNNQLTSVVIPSSVTSIDWNAFQNNQLTSVVIPDSVTDISNNAFYYNQLTSVVIPDGVTSIGGGAFQINQLTEIIFESETPPTIESDTFDNNPALLTEGAIYVPDSAIETYKTATNYVQYADIIKPISERPSDYEKYAYNLFIEAGYTKEDFIVGVDNQQYLTIEDNEIKSVSTKIEFLVIPEGITSIGEDAFEGNQLTSVVIPNSVESIGDGAFSRNQLTSLVIPDGVTTIGMDVFYNNRLTEIIFEGETPPTIESDTFDNNPDLLTQGSIYVPDNSVDTYKTATNYVQYADIIKPISERPE